MQPTDYFEELELAVKTAADNKSLYTMMNSVYMRCLNEQTRGIGLPLSSPYAKTDYLLKKYKASRELTNHINDTRQYFRTRRDQSETELREHFRQDLQNICEFIALITGKTVPANLIIFYPEKQTCKKPKALRLGEYLRVIVENWDEDYAYCHAEAATDETLKVCYTHHNKFKDYNWDYLNKLFYQGAQFNLVRPYKSDDVIYPELWIFEPDYLVDISTVAGCFKEYAHSAMVNIIKRIEKSESTKNTLLGNFAGQLLDESIHQMQDSHTYKDSAVEFFSNNAMKILSAEGMDKSFHDLAKEQKANIDRAMHETLPNVISNFDSKNGIVEPSFFSEMLGLQGRMDFLQLDKKVLIEQKSGKGEFIPGDFSNSVLREKLDHTIQLMLYMAVIRYNYRKEYEENNRELHAFLLYSKYHKSLIDLHFMPEKLFEAFRVRNEIVWNDLVRIRKEGYAVLENLTPDKLNELKVEDTPLWKKCTFHQLSKLLGAIKKCSPVERHYCLRLMKFVAEEHIAAKLGNKEKEGSGFAGSWHQNLDDKEQNGSIMTGLTLDIPQKARSRQICEVTLEMNNSEECDITNLRIGDIVVLHPYQPPSEPDIRTSMVIRGTLKSMDKDMLTIRLRNPQTDSRIFDYFQGKKWAVEKDLMETSFNAAYSNIYSFLSAPKDRRDLLLFQREPRVNKNITLKGDYGDLNKLALKVKQAEDLFLIIGPPGTGKTSFGMLNTLREELLEPASRVLLMSYTNRAVDEMCGKLEEACIDYLRIGSELSCDKTLLSHHINTVSSECENIYQLEYTIGNYRVIAGTVHAFNSQLQFLSKNHFTLAIIDEASQLLEAHLIGLMSCASQDENGETRPTIRKFVMIGDHKQLPAVVQQEEECSVVEEPDLRDILFDDCRQSMFERMLRKYKGNTDLVYQLTRQGRMHPDIADFPNQLFYGGELEPVPLPHQTAALPDSVESENWIEQMLRSKRIAFISIEGPVCAKSDKSNINEAMIIADMLKEIHKIEGADFNPATTVGVIVPYRNQIATIRSALTEADIPELMEVSIDTVERYQGSQRKYIIYGFTVQRPYQLKFLAGNVFTNYDGKIIDRKLNVAMTRAQEHLIMVGNPKIICRDPIFAQLVDYTKSCNSFYISDSL